MKKKITICSSMKFKNEIIAAKNKLDSLGFTILTPDLSEKSDTSSSLSIEEIRAVKRTYILNHFARISVSDAILVLNYEKHGIGGYIGPNTLMEIGVAFNLGKRIYLLFELEEQDCKEEVLALATAILNGNLDSLNQ